ncbi:MAG: hypothetical protein JRN68_06930 [Nitrososphaerota archaeon]|nr:hypothetical protein [Nitrososphaerota archaeon]
MSKKKKGKVVLIKPPTDRQALLCSYCWSDPGELGPMVEHVKIRHLLVAQGWHFLRVVLLEDPAYDQNVDPEDSRYIEECIVGEPWNTKLSIEFHTRKVRLGGFVKVSIPDNSNE